MTAVKPVSLLVGIFLALGFFLLSCGGGGGGTSSTSGGNGGSSQTTLSGTVQPDPGDPSAAGQNSGDTVYVVGQQENATTTDGNGNFNLDVDVTLTNTVLSSPSLFTKLFKAPPVVKTFGLVVISSGRTHGRKTEFTVTDGVVDQISTIYINTVGRISGKAFLQGQNDHTGIRVYIPGTSFQATTDASGNYTMTGVPSGTYDIVRADYSGTVYHYAAVAHVAVTTNLTTNLPDMLLQTSVGPSGRILIDNGAAFTSSETVALSIATSADAVLMMLSQNSDFSGAQWEPVQASKLFIFSGDYSGGGTATIYAKFADASGLESSPIFASIQINTGLSTISNDATPTLSWGAYPNATTYTLMLSTSPALTAPFLTLPGIAGTSYTFTSTPFPGDGVYYWSVMPYNDGVPGTQSDIWTFTLDTVNPAGAVLASTQGYASGTGVMLNEGNPVAVSRALTVRLSATDTGGTGISAYYLSESSTRPTVTAPGWQAISPTTNYIASNLTFTLTSSNNGAKTLHAWFKDRAGNISADYPAVTGLMEFDIETVEAGGVGPYTSLALDAYNTAHISYMDTANNDMRYADNRTPGSWDKQFVDGFGFIAGYYSAISGQPGSTSSYMHISYQDGTSGHLKYATSPGGGPWYETVVDANPLTGQWTAIGLDTNGTVHIAYKEGLAGYLKYATGTYSAFTTTTLEYAGGNGNTAIAVDNSNNVHVSYYNFTDKGFRYRRKSAAGVWSASVLVDNSGTGTYGVGYFNSIATDSTGTVHIAYTDWNSYPTGRLKYATNAGGSWTTMTIDSTAAVGDYNAIDVDSNGKVHISYHDYTNGNLKYATNAFGAWGKVTVDNASAVVGGWTSLKVGSDNRVHISYRDQTNAALKYTRSR